MLPRRFSLEPFWRCSERFLWIKKDVGVFHFLQHLFSIQEIFIPNWSRFGRSTPNTSSKCGDSSGRNLPNFITIFGKIFSKLTSFSILFARLKGDLKEFYDGAKYIDKLKDNDTVLICESCSHHQIEDDIARVKIPKLLTKKTGKKLEFVYHSGHDFPQDLEKYSLLIHCGACMTNRKEVLSRIMKCKKAGLAISNYGIVISYCLGILDRAVKPFNI